MARGKKQLSNAFDDFSKKRNTENESVSESIKQNTEEQSVMETIVQNTKIENENNEQIHTQETQQENVMVISTNKDTPDDVTVLSNTNNVTNDVIQSEKSLSVQQVKHDLLNMYQEKSKKETVEDTHTRTTFLFRNDLAKRLDKLAKNKRGFKTMMINKAIEALLNELEKE
jgi:hypothetical protein